MEAWAWRHDAEKLLEDLLRQMRDLCAQAKVDFMVTRFTTGGESGRDKWLEAICQRAGIRFVGLSHKFTGDAKHYMARKAGELSYDGHYGEQGTKTFSEALGPGILTALQARGAERRAGSIPAGAAHAESR